MVKRQTVWLSTMMVLSLMLIGYYTMNNEPGTPASGSQDATSAVTPDTSGSAQSTAGDTQTTAGNTQTTAGSTQKSDGNNPGSTDNSKGTSTAAGSSDWYVEYQTQLNQDMDQQIDTYSKLLTNSNATEAQLSQAQQQLTNLKQLQGGIGNAHDMIVAKGYKDCVIVPNKDYTKFTVYVKTSKLSADQAVQIMHIVSQQLNISAINVNVSAKA